MPEEYLARLDRQRPEVERIRDAAQARGDSTTARNAQRLLTEWARAAARQPAANDFGPVLRPVA